MTRTSSVHSVGGADFALHTLGWRNFQDFCGVMLDKVLGQTFVVFADSNDGGRDGAFYGQWKETVIDGTLTGVSSGATVMQCKFTVKANATLSVSQIQDELSKIAKLVAEGRCDNYILLTNAKLSGQAEAKLRQAIMQAGATQAYVLDGRWLCRKILANQSLRMFVPRVYGLGDLSQILDERSYDQAKVLLDQLDGLSTFVVTEAYKKAAKSLKDNAFVLLLGEPASGKSVIAASLAMVALDHWKSGVVKVMNAQDFLNHWNPHEPNQFFWIDDAFGAVRHEQELTDAWSRAFPTLMAAVRKGARVVMTSRDYIYREARPFLKDYAYPLLKEAQVVINVSRLTADEKQKMLYNHIKLGNQTTSFKTALIPHLKEVSEVRVFLPEVARRLGTTTFTKHVDPSNKQAVLAFIEKPNDFLNDIFSELDANHKAALALVYKSTKLPSPVKLNDEQKIVVDRFGGTTAKINESLKSLAGTFLRYSPRIDAKSGSTFWTFHHPTLREGYARFIMTSPDLIDIFIDGLTIEEVIEQLDCGTSKDRGQLLRVPASSYGHVISRLQAYDAHQRLRDSLSRYQNNIRLNSFLIRASKRFLQGFIAANPHFITHNLLPFSTPIISQSKLLVLDRLSEYKLLPEAIRLDIVAQFKRLAISVPDSGWLSISFSHLMTEQEKSELLGHVEHRLIPTLEGLIEEWENNEDAEDESYYANLEECLERYRDAFWTVSNDEAYDQLFDAVSTVSTLSEAHVERLQEREIDDSLYDDDRPHEQDIQQQRSMFDDVDL